MIGLVTGTGMAVGAAVVQKKTIAIFTYKHSVFSLDMKTKVGRHVPRINIFNHFIGGCLTAMDDYKLNK